MAPGAPEAPPASQGPATPAAPVSAPTTSLEPITFNGNEIDINSVQPDFFPRDASQTDFILLITDHYLERREILELEARGVKIQRRDGSEFTYLCKYPSPLSDLASIEALPFIIRALTYHPDFVIYPTLKNKDAVLTSRMIHTKPSNVLKESPLCDVVVTLHEDTQETGDKLFENLQSLVDRDAGLQMVQSDSESLRAWVPYRLLATIARMDKVMAIHPGADNVVTTAKMGPRIGLPIPTGWYDLAWSFLADSQAYRGSGQIICICDTGLDKGIWRGADKHPAFGDRVVNATNTTNFGLINLAHNPIHPFLKDVHTHSHGTHVAGCAGGEYVEKTSAKDHKCRSIRGMAPRANIYVQSHESGLTFAQRIQLLVAEQPGCKIHNNSYKSGGTLTYAGSAAPQMDQEMNDDLELLIVVGAANDAKFPTKWWSGDQRYFNRQIGQNAGAKNIITVGATWNSRQMNNADPTFDADNCIEGMQPKPATFRTELPHSVALFSSKGPSFEGRVKPDVVAPGAGILSSWSRTVECVGTKEAIFEENGCPFPALGFQSGTSMATPIVSGLAACIREAITRNPRSGQGAPVHAATVKGILINAAVSCAGANFWYIDDQGIGNVLQGVLGEPPDCIQGYGEVNYGRSIEHITNMAPLERSHQYTGYHYNAAGIAQNAFWPPQGFTLNQLQTTYNTWLASGTGNDTRRHERAAFFVPRATDNKIQVTLTYNDQPGPLLVNELRLRVFRYVVTDNNDWTTIDAVTPQPNPRSMPAQQCNAYAICPSYPANNPGPQAPGNPAPPVRAMRTGNVQKVIWTNIGAGVNRATQSIIFKIEIHAVATHLATRVPFAICWMSES